MEDRNGTIYMYTSPSGKCYIGQTWKPNKRKAAHRAMSGNSVAFFNAIKSYGFENMTYSILHSEVKTQDEMNRLESLEIKNRDTLSPNGYNLNGGGGAQGVRSAETRARLSAARLGKHMSPESREKIGRAGRGLKRSPETLERMRAANIGRKHSLETREQMSISRRGRKLSQEAKDNIGKAVRGRKASPETKEKQRKWNTGRKMSPEAIEKTRIANIGRKASPETREKIRQAGLIRWQKIRDAKNSKSE